MLVIFAHLHILDLISAVLLCLFILKKIVDMKRFHTIRVVFLTAILWVIAGYFLSYCFPSNSFDDCIEFPNEANTFNCTEVKSGTFLESLNKANRPEIVGEV